MSECAGALFALTAPNSVCNYAGLTYRGALQWLGKKTKKKVKKINAAKKVKKNKAKNAVKPAKKSKIKIAMSYVSNVGTSFRNRKSDLSSKAGFDRARFFWRKVAQSPRFARFVSGIPLRSKVEDSAPGKYFVSISRVNADEVTFGIVDQRHVPVLANTVLTFIDLASDFRGDRFFVGTIFACKIHDRVDSAGDKVPSPYE